MTSLIEIPQHSLSVSSSRCAERPVGGDGDSVEVLSVSVVVSLQLAVGQTPHLDYFVPASRHNQRGAGVGRESHA